MGELYTRRALQSSKQPGARTGRGRRKWNPDPTPPPPRRLEPATGAARQLGTLGGGDANAESRFAPLGPDPGGGSARRPQAAASRAGHPLRTRAAASPLPGAPLRTHSWSWGTRRAWAPPRAMAKAPGPCCCRPTAALPETPSAVGRCLVGNGSNAPRRASSQPGRRRSARGRPQARPRWMRLPGASVN